jgi:hypothetical protein
LSRGLRWREGFSGESMSVLKGLDVVVKTEADRDKAMSILRSVGHGDEPLSDASMAAVPVFLLFLRRLPDVPVDLVPDLIGASFELARKINEMHPTLLPKHSRETIAALSQMFAFMPSGSRWVVCDMLAQLLVGCGEAAGDATLAMLLDADLVIAPLACVWPLVPARDAFETITYVAVMLKRALASKSPKANQIVDTVVRRGGFGERLGERLLEKKEAMPPEAVEFCENLYVLLVARFPGSTGSKALQLKVAVAIGNAEMKATLSRLLNEWHGKGAITDTSGVPTLDDLLSFE